MADKACFVVLVDGDATVAQRDAFTAYLRDSRAGFWHHVSHGWLITTFHTDMTAKALRDKVRELMPTVVHLVIQVNPVTWSGAFKSKAGDWMRQNWD